MSIKRTIIVTAAILASVAMVAPSLASALTTQDLLIQIQQLQAQLLQLQGQEQNNSTTGVLPANCVGITFNRNLARNSVGSDVKCLQTLLNQLNVNVADAGAGSSGHETTFFGGATRAAVIRFQEMFKAEILTPVGLTVGTGNVYASTRAKLNALLGNWTSVQTSLPAGCTSTSGYSSTTGASCATGVPVTPTLPAGCTTNSGYSPTTGQSCGNGAVVPVVGGGLSVALAYDTPAAGSVASGANANFAKLTLTAGSGAVNISNIYITRGGYSANADLQNIEVVDATTGIYYGNIGSINSDSRALISFTQPLVIAAGTSRSFYLRAGYLLGTATAGETATLGIAQASDIVSNASSVSGNFPATGNTMTCVTLTIGSLVAYEDGTTVDSKPNVGDKQVILNNFKLLGGTTEDVTVQTISMLKAGTANNVDLANYTLYDVTKGTVVGTATNLTAEGKAAWSGLNIVIAKGGTERFQIKADIVDGPGLTANADIVDGSNVLVTVVGNTYGFYITPTSAIGDWAGGTAALEGMGANPQTIQNGASTISRSTLSPATGNISAGSDIPLTTFDFYVTGESVRITSLKLTTTLSTVTVAQVTNVKVFDENGIIVAGPKDMGGTYPTGVITFTDVFVVPVGTHHFTVKAQIASAATGNLYAGIADAATDVLATGMTDNATVVFAPTSAVNGNVQTIKVAALAVVTNTAAVSKVAVGSHQVIFGTAALDATNSGEDVNVTSINVVDTASPTSTVTDLQNMTLWADLTSDNSARGDIYETQIGNPVNQSAATTTFSLTRTVTFKKGSFVPVALIADLSTSATVSGADTDGNTNKITFGSTAGTTGVTSNGALTGTSITNTNSGTALAKINQSYGTITTTVDSSSPAANILLGGSTATLGVFKIAETSNVENVNINDITLAVTSGTKAVRYDFYNGTTYLGQATSGTAPKLVLTTGQLVVPANGNVLVTVKAVINAVDGTTVANGATIIANLANAAVNGTGVSSGHAIASTSILTAGGTMVIEKARPYFALDASSPSGASLKSSTQTLAIFDVSNTNGGDDVVFDDSTSGSASDQIIINISNSLAVTNSTQRLWKLTDGGSTIYATTYTTDSSSPTTLTFKDFGTTKTVGSGTNTAFAISPNTSKKLYVIGDTTEYTHSSSGVDSIQLSLTPTSTYCEYTIGAGTSAQAMGAYIFSPQVNGGTLTY